MSGHENEATAHAGKQALVVRSSDNDFQREVLAKLVRLEAKVDMLFGSYQQDV